MFNQIDANHDGRVVWDEAWNFVQQRFTEADRDHDGGLTQEEMRAARVMRRQARDGAQQANRPASSQQQGRFTGMMFRMLDANRDGKVTLDEIRPMVEARFRGFDANGDNAVTLDEVPQRAAHRHHRAPAQRQPG
jgi:Ca2+-binding EF-hand superfamily protein